jgi:hypothetical protein
VAKHALIDADARHPLVAEATIRSENTRIVKALARGPAGVAEYAWSGHAAVVGAQLTERIRRSQLGSERPTRGSFDLSGYRSG